MSDAVTETDILETLSRRCDGDIHGTHPCGSCIYCLAAKEIVRLRTMLSNYSRPEWAKRADRRRWHGR